MHHSSDGMFSIRQGDWKLELGLGSGGFSAPLTIEPKPGGPKGQLYNIGKDPTEADNVWMQHPEVVSRLTALLDRYKSQGYQPADAALDDGAVLEFPACAHCVLQNVEDALPRCSWSASEACCC